MKIAVRVLICVGCLIPTGIFILNVVEEIQRVRHIQVWPAEMARIVDMAPAGYDSEEDTHGIRVGYQYDLRGAMYAGAASIWGRSGEPAEDLSRSYPVGSKLRIVYNPVRPAESIVADDRQARLNPGLILGGILVLVVDAFMIRVAFSATAQAFR